MCNIIINYNPLSLQIPMYLELELELELVGCRSIYLTACIYLRH